MQKTQRGVRIPLSGDSWRLILRALNEFAKTDSSVSHKAISLKDYIETRLPRA